MWTVLKYAVAGVVFANAAQADVTVTFRDGAPKDRFTINNTSSCATGPIALTFDLHPAPAGLIFDVTNGGAGVEVFQPFEVTSGGEWIEGVSAVADGDQSLTLQLRDMPDGGEVSFTIDLDDTGGGREITVSGAEISGAMVKVSSDVDLGEGVFNDQGHARVIFGPCTS